MTTTISSFPTTVLIAGIDTIRQKNVYQLEGLRDYGYRFIIITVDPDGNSRDHVKGLDNVEIFTFPNRWSRPLMALALLKIILRNDIKLFEVYPFSYGQFILPKCTVKEVKRLGSKQRRRSIPIMSTIV